MSALMSTYQTLPITIEKGDGKWLYDTHGKKYLDAFAGIGVCNLGHCHPKVVAAIAQQAAQLIHCSNMLGNLYTDKLAAELTALAQMDKAFFCNSGAEANECAIKMARLYGNKREIKNPSIIVMENAFHGRTLATLAAGGSRKAQAGFEPLVTGFLRAPFNDIEALEKIALNHPEVVAILFEPVQGEGGVRPASPHYLAQVRKLCDQHDWLMMLDEVQTGMGRTGKLFAFQHANIIPDVVALAKSLGNGFPIGACLSQGKANDIFHVGNHGSTFGGNALACAASLATLNVFQHENILENVAQVGPYLQQQLEHALKNIPQVVAIRGQGLLIGIELNTPCRHLLMPIAEQGLLVSVTAEKVIRLAPPLIINKQDADFIVDTLARVLQQQS
ncbi:MAG: aspartate aminotransferase family protein [Gammaproteobacteria bacterium]|jgi:acetylornithine aminotransferase